MKPQTIQIFLPDGSPTSIREAEITNRLLKAILFPRNKIQEVAKREMVHFTGVYFLFGLDEDGRSPKVYIGEGEDCYNRILAHNRNKDFWTHCIVISTKTNEYTKTDGKYLEYFCLDLANRIGRYKTGNDTGSKKPSIPESREHDLLDNFDTIKILLATLGYPIFEELIKKDQTSSAFLLSGEGVLAKGELTDEGFVILKGSQVKIANTLSCPSYIVNMKNELIQANVLVLNKEVYEFSVDYIFNSPSTSAGIVLGRTVNGWKKWKNKEGKTLDEIKRK